MSDIFNSQHLFAPHDIAGMLGVSVMTVRRWADYHKAHLSEHANPPHGKVRAFTWADVEKFRQIKTLRDSGLNVTAINNMLSSATAESITPTVIRDSATALRPPPDVPHNTLAPAMDGYIVLAIQKRIEALELANVTTAQNQRAVWWWVAVGIVIGLALAGLADLFALVVSRGHG